MVECDYYVNNYDRWRYSHDAIHLEKYDEYATSYKALENEFIYSEFENDYLKGHPLEES